jgi:hypothetical protein
MMTFLKPKPCYHWSQGYDVFKKNRHPMSDNLAWRPKMYPRCLSCGHRSASEFLQRFRSAS